VLIYVATKKGRAENRFGSSALLSIKKSQAACLLAAWLCLGGYITASRSLPRGSLTSF